MKKLRRKFWGTFVKNSKYENSTEFENFVDEFVVITEFDSIEELGKIYNIILEGFENEKDCKVVLLESSGDDDIFIVTSAEFFAKNMIDLLNKVIGTHGATTTSKGIEPIYELIDIEIVG